MQKHYFYKKFMTVVVITISIRLHTIHNTIEINVEIPQKTILVILSIPCIKLADVKILRSHFDFIRPSKLSYHNVKSML